MRADSDECMFQLVKSVEAELRDERQLNQNLSATLEQMKNVLDTTIKSRDEARHKYRMLKKSVAKMVSIHSLLGYC